MIDSGAIRICRWHPLASWKVKAAAGLWQTGVALAMDNGFPIFGMQRMLQVAWSQLENHAPLSRAAARLQRLVSKKVWSNRAHTIIGWWISRGCTRNIRRWGISPQVNGMDERQRLSLPSDVQIQDDELVSLHHD